METGLLNNIIKLKEKCSVLLEDFGGDLGISSREASVLLAIGKDVELSSNNLAEQVHLSPSRVSRIVDKLIKMGYLKRKNSKVDRRVIKISLSAKGLDAQKKISIIRELCEKRITEKIKKDDMEIVNRALTILLQSLE